MVKSFLATLALLAQLTYAAAQSTPSLLNGPPTAPVPRIATVSANLSGAGRVIPSNFVGLSGEVGDLITGFYQGTTGPAASFLGIMNMLGPNGILRLGGSSSDSLAPTPPALTSGIASNLAAFVSGLGSGWKLIYGLDLFANNSSVAASQAGLITTAMGANTPTFQIGNEANSYYTSAQYTTNWNLYYTAINGTVPGVKIDAATLGNWGTTQSYTSGLVGSTTGVGALTGLTTHWYNANGQLVNAAQLVSSPHTLAVPTGFFLNQNYANTQGVPLGVDESNSVSGGGQSGFSDRLMASAWYLNEAFQMSTINITFIDTHNFFADNTGPNNNGWYNPIVLNLDGNFQPGPIFYGMLLFSKIEGETTIPFSIAGNANVTAIAALGVNGNANMIVVNDDQFESVKVTPTQSVAWTSASILKVRDGDGFACASASPIIGGQPIGEGGAWSGKPFTIQNGQTFVLEPCASALVKILP